MIIYRKLYYIGHEDGFSIWEYNTETKQERMVYDNEDCDYDEYNDDIRIWHKYELPTKAGGEREVRLSKVEAFAEMI